MSERGATPKKIALQMIGTLHYPLSLRLSRLGQPNSTMFLLEDFMLRLVLVFLILGATASWSQQDMRLAILGNGDLDRLNIVTTVASNAGLGFISADA